MYTWGRGWEGQLGHDVVTEIELEPHIVPKMENRGSSAVACGRNHTVVVTDNGLIYTCGENKAGQLGTGDLKSSNSPVLIESLEEQEIISIACGSEHSIAVSIANEVYGWGSGVYDQLGLGTLGIFPKPQRIPGLTVPYAHVERPSEVLGRLSRGSGRSSAATEAQQLSATTRQPTC